MPMARGLSTARNTPGLRSYRLKEIRAAADKRQAVLLRELAAAGRLHGIDVAPEASLKRMVSGWENGAPMSADYRRLFCRVYGKTEAELGFEAATPTDLERSSGGVVTEALGTEYPEGIDEAVTALDGLWKADQEDVRAVVSAPTVALAWPSAGLSWLVRTGPDTLPDRPAGSRVGAADIERLRTTVTAFADMDDRFGGGHARRALVQYLRSDVPALLAGRYGERTGRQLFSAVAEATLLTAWMSYDSGVHGLAQRYFVQALRLAQAADDTLLAGSILDAMSHQATFLGRHREAATLARAARQGTTGKATPTLTAHFYAMEARALAVGGDGLSAQRALSEAVRVFERREPGEDPEWIAYFDDAELSAEFSHCFRDTGRFTDAITYAQRALTGSVRSDFFVTMVLAAGHLGNGDADEAAAVARRALDMGAALRSARCSEYVLAFRRQLSAAGHRRTLLTLDEEAADHPLWRPARSAA